MSSDVPSAPRLMATTPARDLDQAKRQNQGDEAFDVAARPADPEA
jgi:hypothetical protein